ncbi:uncharacterized protein LOC127496289 isoform X18 [Ctenopharyngodon idella]|uniref:uncharacterized protein LOC127496289 isoform X18 n=1 Tax=Ctenopharyngodon idella TaxID=7959 RepID=UPI0022304D9D|nr:uncharacterized protein LOC127496289 isoform X18 [Ctenopharyngodon idella]
MTGPLFFHLLFQAPFHYEADKTTGLKTLHFLVPSLVFLLACILAGVIIYKKRNGQMSMSERRTVLTNNEHRSDIRTNTCENKPFSKPRMPSPKSEPKSYPGYDYEGDYANMEELNVYGNI